MRKFIKTQAVVIKSEDFGEADRLITLLSGYYGLIKAIVKGARKVKSRLAPGAQFLSVGQYDLYQGKTFFTVTQCEEKRVFKSIYADVDKFIYASAIAELVACIASEGEPNYPIYNLTIKVLREIDDCVKNCENYLIYFMLKALEIAGFKPETNVCVECGVSVKAPRYFSISGGGIICSDCMHTKSQTYSYSITPDVAAVLRYMLSTDIKGLKSLVLNKDVIYKTRKLLEEFVNYHFEKEIKSLQFIIEKESV